MKKIILIFMIFFNNNNLLAQQFVTGNFMETPLTIHFINEDIGFVGGANSKWVGEIISTTDGGKSWNRKYVNPSATFANMWMFDQNNILISGGSKLFRTTNSGNNWFTILVPAQVSLTSLFFVNENVGYISGD